MRFVILLLFATGALSFQHEAPGSPCVTNAHNFPADANASNTYDYIVVGAGTASSVLAARLAEGSSCQLSILVLESGRSYTNNMPPTCAPGSIACHNYHIENKIHIYPGARSNAYRETWNYVSTLQTDTYQIAHSDGRDPMECPYPDGCDCTSVKNNNNQACLVYQACITANPGDVTQCGRNTCGPLLCARNATNLYPRASSKGGSSSQNTMITYKMSPQAAARWVAASGDSRFAWSNWEKTLKDMAADWLSLSYVSNNYAPSTTVDNNTVYDLLRAAFVADGIYDGTAPGQRVTNDAEFFPSITTPNPHLTGQYFSDKLLGRQVSKDGYRSFPSHVLDRAASTCMTTFHVACSTHATRLLFNDGPGNVLGRSAQGVEYVEDMDAYELDFNFDRSASDALPRKKAYARKGVILGAGSFNSVQLLKLSGIGPTAELDALGIPVRKHLPAVGENMQDDCHNPLHFSLVGTDPKAANYSLDSGFGSRPFHVPDVIKALYGYSSSNFDDIGFPNVTAVSTGSFCHSSAGLYNGSVCPLVPNSMFTLPDDPAYLEALQGNPSILRDVSFSGGSVFFYGDDDAQAAGEVNCAATFTTGVVFLSPYDTRLLYFGTYGQPLLVTVVTTNLKSRGRVTLNSTSPFSTPLIDPRTQSNTNDTERIVSCINRVRRIIREAVALSEASGGAYGGLNFTEPGLPYSVPPDTPVNTPTETMREHARNHMWTAHASGTNRIGTPGEVNSVVDSRGRVWGTENLYIVDLSTTAGDVPFYPAASGMVLGHMQAESLLANDPPATRFCNPTAFKGASGIDKLDVGHTPLELGLGYGLIAGIIGLVVIVGVAVAIVSGVATGAGAVSGGATVLASIRSPLIPVAANSGNVRASKLVVPRHRV